MCIFNSKEVKVTNDITVYKVVLKAIYGNDNEPHWVTPFQKAILNEDIISGKSPFIADGCWNRDYEPGDIISKGYIHTYRTLEDTAKDYGFYLHSVNPNEYEVEVYECVIPIPRHIFVSHYCWSGTFDDTSLESVAAREIRFVRQVSSDELLTAYNGRTDEQY